MVSMAMTKAELMELAESLKLDPDPRMTKAELVEVILTTYPEKGDQEPLAPGPVKQEIETDPLKDHPKFAKFKTIGEPNS